VSNIVAGNSKGGITAVPCINDDGLEYLKGLKNLRVLLIRWTKVTDAGVEKLQQALPNCRIAH
jgi:hypothetical protein